MVTAFSKAAFSKAAFSKAAGFLEAAAIFDSVPLTFNLYRYRSICNVIIALCTVMAIAEYCKVN
jgi:hypothetical protein